MPEGDTIHRTAIRMRAAIEGRVVEGFESPRRVALEQRGQDLVGRTISKVEARGKFLLVRFDDGRTLETHMKMNGSWHLYRPGERWRFPTSQVVACIRTDAFVAVCAGAPVCRLVRGLSDDVAGLGPDLLDPNVDLDEAVARLRSQPDLAMGLAIMRQDLVAGIGNVYKSEILFEHRIDPFGPVSDVDDPTLLAMLEGARKHLRRNLRTRKRGTKSIASPQKVWVYTREGEPCYECGEPIGMRRQGREIPRSTYFCPRCQGVDVVP